MINNIFSVLVILLPLLYQYKSPISSIALGEFILIPFIIYYIINYILKRKRIKLDERYLLFLYIVIINTLIVGMFSRYFVINESLTVIIRIVFYSMLILVSIDNYKFSFAMRIYNKIVVLLSIYLIIQYLYTKFTGDYLPIYLNYNWIFAPERRALDLDIAYRYMFRPSSLFLEPSYFTLYSLPAIAYNLCFQGEVIKNRILKSLIITVALLASSSGAGIVGAVIVWGGYFFPKQVNKVNVKKLLLVVIMIGVLIFIYNSEFASVGIERLSKGGSIGQRIERGIIIFKDLSIFNKFFGIGINNLANYMNFYSIKTVFDESNLNYLADSVGVIVNSGITAYIFYGSYIIGLLKKSRERFTVLITIIFIYCSLYEGLLFTYRMGFYLIIIYGSIIHSRSLKAENLEK